MEFNSFKCVKNLVLYMSFTMKKVKLLVFLFYVNIVWVRCQKYCEICPNHTLCRFPIAGPSPLCARYDRNKLLTQEDVKIILDKINDRRNYIALNRSKYLPGAANMKKIVWSDELAKFAQRWVDQCDPSTNPDKEDDCRNLRVHEVGQNIATMSDLSAGFSVKSFVEMWFMQSLDYSGSVTFYNQSENRTKYFTQLLWANTESVGCGQASFYIVNLHVTLRRLVCNFAPKGNVIGKPIYIIGYPATQCETNMVPDMHYQGLCSLRDDEKQVMQTPPVSSLLRIINLSDSPALRGNKTKSNDSSQLALSMLVNKTHAAVKRYPHSFWAKTSNHSKPRENYLHENAYRVNRKPSSYNNLITSHKNSEQGFNEYEPRKTTSQYSKENYRKHKQESFCTRNENVYYNECEDSSKKFAKCTRGQNHSKSTLTVRQSYQPQDMCICDTYTSTPTTTAYWIANKNCRCLNKNNAQILCSNLRRQQEESFKSDKEKTSTFYYYDLLPNLHIQQEMKRENLQNKFSTYPLQDEDETADTGPYRRKGHIQRYRIRHKRNDKQYTTIRPFWEIDDTLHKRTLQRKAVRYTTLTNRKIKQRIHTSLRTSTKNTEPITVKLKPKANSFLNKQSVITEKYLSFDELMQLRKMNMGSDFESRRKDDSNTTTTVSTTIEITANTPFIRMKHCTRKLTCTWTVPRITDCNGSVIADNDSNRGSRTPPGYVDGCTRTSTCTRDYMDRNKLGSSTEENSDSIATEIDDEDYCERRSLKINRRNYHEEIKPRSYNSSSLEFLATTSINTGETISITQSESNNNDCQCDDFSNKERNKRDEVIYSKYHTIHQNKYDKKSKTTHYENIHYGELYYKILEKIKTTWRESKKSNKYGRCFCTGSSLHQSKTFLLFLFVCTRCTR